MTVWLHGCRLMRRPTYLVDIACDLTRCIHIFKLIRTVYKSLLLTEVVTQVCTPSCGIRGQQPIYICNTLDCRKLTILIIYYTTTYSKTIHVSVNEIETL